jgi:2EXR family
MFICSEYTPSIRHRTFKLAAEIDWREFPLFPEFPTELRLKIWAFASADPRIMTIEQIPLRAKDYRTFCQDRVPSILLANRESRSVALKRYRLAFAKFENVYGPPTYFDFNRDIVCLRNCGQDWWEDFNEEFNNDLGLVQRVMIENGNCRFREISQRVMPFQSIRSLGISKKPGPSHFKISEMVFYECLALLMEPSRDPKKTAEALKTLRFTSFSNGI